MSKTHTISFPFAIAAAMAVVCFGVSAEDWIVDSQQEWEEAIRSSDHSLLEDGAIAPEANGEVVIQSVVKRFGEKRKAATLSLKQSPVWQNWESIPNLGPSNLADAPVLLTLGPDDYWMFGRYGKKRGGKEKKFLPEEASLEGFDVPLKTTPFPNQYDAPGAENPSLGGYHAWQSRDMENWVHHGPVTEAFSRWVTSAEYVDGKVLIYYDYPNDQDPHVYVDEDLTDGIPGKDIGMAFEDPSHGSDAGFIRDLEGKVHVIYEDWSPINASKRSWDSPLAGRAVSEDGLKDFTIKAPAIDNRTTPTGKKATYKHPHWLQHPNWDTNLGEYEIHEPEQEAYGDWAAIAIGGRYYLFGDYDPAGGHEMAVGWFTSPSLDEEFVWCDKIGKGHPDPDICFAEGKFYLATQQSTDYVSDGPWVESVEARVGVDVDNDGEIDEWTGWQQVRETYDYIPGFSKQVAVSPAELDLSALPAGYGFQFEVKLHDSNENKSKPILERIEFRFGSPQ